MRAATACTAAGPAHRCTAGSCTVTWQVTPVPDPWLAAEMCTTSCPACRLLAEDPGSDGAASVPESLRQGLLVFQVHFGLQLSCICVAENRNGKSVMAESTDQEVSQGSSRREKTSLAPEHLDELIAPLQGALQEFQPTIGS